MRLLVSAMAMNFIRLTGEEAALLNAPRPHVTQVIISASGHPVTLCDGGLTSAQREVTVMCIFRVVSDQQRPEVNAPI